MDIGITSKYKSNIEDIDAIFETSLILKGIFENALENILKNNNLNFNQRKIVNNKLLSLANIEDKSIKDAEAGAWERLYPQALILVVSISEQLLKEIFEVLVYSNLEKLNGIDDISFKLKDVIDKSFKLSRKDWVELVVKKLYGEVDPNEKINFQNILAIKGIFNNYFRLEINLSEKLQKDLHFYYQCRHIIIHNGSIVDERFIKNLAKAKYPRQFIEGEKIIITSNDFDKCKSVFLEFFDSLETAIKNADIKYLTPSF
ncbi:MAG: hypothetical protein M1308_23195 [Actinobacteria bacterium]|nr:hypothetical protein [Actinomycetota bacterium]